ncbi:universal stress protein [Streptomyces sp. cmx-4-7]|uniref:universal stress protein n=1 Tax=Streptomyces sp. cmx-4-7 TaxID=2790939 RepID=UPI0039814E74
MTEQQAHRFERGTDGPKVIMAGVDGPASSLRAAAYAADAVVVGASESAGHRFVGSVAVRLVKAGRRPVTVVP